MWPQGSLMDTMKLDMLEQYVQQLLALLAQVKEDNVRLTQNTVKLQQALQEQQHLVVSWEAAQTELRDLRTVTNTLRQERGLIRTKLEAILEAVEHLEEMSSPVEKH